MRAVARVVPAATVACVIATACVVVTPAGAQQPAVPVGNYGGGVVLAPPGSIYTQGNMLIGLRASGGVVRMNVSMALSCSVSAVFTARARPSPDGTFKVKGSSSRRVSGGRLVRTSYTIDATIAGLQAHGSARARTSIRRGGRTTRCPTAKVRWRARRSTGNVEPSPPVPKSRLNGTTSQRLSGPRRAITMRISSDGAKLARALYDVTVRCDGATITDAFDAPRRDLTIAADGSVSDTERFTLRRGGEVYRSVERFSATIGSDGARGTFSTSTRVSDRRTGRTLRRCRSGTVHWTAAP